MNTKIAQTNSNLVRSITIGGIGVAILGLTYYLLRRSSKNKQRAAETTKPDNHLTKELLIKLLKEIRREMTTVVMELAIMCRELKPNKGDIPLSKAIEQRIELRNYSFIPFPFHLLITLFLWYS